MKISDQWLREWIDPALDVETLGHRLTMAGLEVDAIEAVCQSTLEHVVVAQVLSLTAHPDADKLRVCQVDVGAAKPLTIVCGAANVTALGKYPAALEGACLPNGLSIKPTTLRGVASQGMLCSSTELGLHDATEGLFELPADAPVGESLYTYLGLQDHVIELGLTPNRGDCLSIRGVAREVAVICGQTDYGQTDCARPVKEVTINTVKPTSKETLTVSLEAESACPRYLGRVIQGVDVAATTPLWLRERLRRAGLRSISAIVDITNYILIELGQPMHAFDWASVVDGIVVRMSKPSESLTLLDGQTLQLSSDSLVIADHVKPLALAGIMGGAESAVGANTKDILLEAAFFNPLAIAGKARGYGLHTDSSHRFERGVDFELPALAMERATELVLAIAGGKAGPVVAQTAKKHLPQRLPICLRKDRVTQVLGHAIAGKDIAAILTRLGFAVAKGVALNHKNGDSQQWQVTPPSFRFDVELEIDLIEEVARIHGYHNIPQSDARMILRVQPKAEAEIPLDRLKDLLVARGYQEAITYSFIDPALQLTLTAATEAEVISLQNPISADMAQMRISLLAGLLQAAIYNSNRQQDRIRLFETGLVYRRQNDQIEQVPHIAGVILGSVHPEQWAMASVGADFFDLKSDVEALLALTCQPTGYLFVPDKHPAMHPGQCARITYQDNDGTTHPVGWLGSLHPELQKKFDLNARVVMFELQLEPILVRQLPVFTPLSKYPAIRRDLAIVVDESVSMSRVGDCVKKIAADSLKKFQLFDEYRGKGIDSGRKSLAFGITLQNHDRTLTDAEVDTIIARIIMALEQELEAKLRE